MTGPDYLKVDHVPTLCIRVECGTCGQDVEMDEEFTCPTCGTTWPITAGDGATGERFEGWADLPGDPLDEFAAYLRASQLRQKQLDTERQARERRQAEQS